MNRFLIPATVLLLVGIVLWLATRPEAAFQQMPEMPEFASDRAQSIEIAGGEVSSVRFRRSDAGWKLLTESGEEHHANKDAVLHLLNDLAAMQPIRVVTNNPEQHQKLMVGPKAIRVTVKDQHEVVLLEVMVGKQGSDLLSTYIRVTGQQAVLAVDRSLAWQVNRSLDGWQQHDLAPAESAASRGATDEQ